MRAVLFDLDGTLLDLDLPAFLARYFAALRGVIAAVLGEARADEGIRAVLDATRAMSEPHDGCTNRDVFTEVFASLTGVDLDSEWDRFDEFYEYEFPSLGEGLGPSPGAHRAVRAAIDSGMCVAVATNPIFPLRAIEHRITWAGLDPADFDLVTSYESMRATKPHAAYYRQIAEALGVAERECMMVGDDPLLDMAAADVGMRTFYVGAAPAEADLTGDLDALADLLPRLAAS